MNYSLFDRSREEGAVSDAGTPLPERMRPRSLDEVVGHESLVGSDGFLRQALIGRRVPSLVFWGPPGAGKTTLARLLAEESELEFRPYSAVTSGIKEVKQVMADAQRMRQSTGRQTLLFVDEIHRFNRAQQDAFLPYVERGDIVLVGATTENPSFELNAALLSRCRVVVLEPLSVESLSELLVRALEDRERGLGKQSLSVDPEAIEQIAQLASGDARKALNLLEAVAESVAVHATEGPDADESGPERSIDLEAVQQVSQRKVLLYDKSGEEHFNLISALHKSLRESDVDAAMYWLARMLAAGEDPLYVARRLVRFASEDVGLADPRALPQTIAAWQAFQRLGSPEGELALAQATVYLALAPKSNAVYRAYKAVRKTVEVRPADPVPKSIRNAPTRLMGDLGYGKGYVYAHDTDEGIAGLDCLPESLQGTRFYQPTDQGFEARIGERLQQFEQIRARARRTASDDDPKSSDAHRS